MATETLNATSAELKQMVQKAHEAVETARSGRKTQVLVKPLEAIEGRLKELFQQAVDEEREQERVSGFYDEDGYHEPEKPSMFDHRTSAVDTAQVRRMRAAADAYDRQRELGERVFEKYNPHSPHYKGK